MEDGDDVDEMEDDDEMDEMDDGDVCISFILLRYLLKKQLVFFKRCL